MKKLIFALSIVLLLVGVSDAGDYTIATVPVLVSRTVAANTSVTSRAYDLNSGAFQPQGYFSLHSTITGTGTLKITYELSNNYGVRDVTTTWVEPASASDIVTAQTVGDNFYSFTPELARAIRFVFEETGDANPVVVTATLAVQ